MGKESKRSRLGALVGWGEAMAAAVSGGSVSDWVLYEREEKAPARRFACWPAACERAGKTKEQRNVS